MFLFTYIIKTRDHIHCNENNTTTTTNTNSNNTTTNPFDTPTPVNRNNNVVANNNTNINKTDPQPNGSQPTIFRAYQLKDPGMNNITASTILYPEGWEVEGGLVRTGPRYFNVPFIVDLKFTAPDGRQAHFMPSMSFEFDHNNPGQEFTPTNGGSFYLPLPESPGKFIMDMAAKNPAPGVSNLRLISEQTIPELTEKLRQNNAMMFQSVEQNNRQSAQLGQMSGYYYQQAYDTQATAIKLQYTEDGKQYEQAVLMTWSYMLNVTNGQVSSGFWSIGLMRSARGPVGTDYINDPQIMAVFQTARNNPAWEAEMQKHWQEMARIRAKGAADRQASWAAHNRKMQQINNETSEIISQGYKNREAIRDAGYAKQIDSIHEVSPYRMPDGTTMKIPDYYDNVHTDGTGRFILSNDFKYNPNRDLNLPGTWTKIEPMR